MMWASKNKACCHFIILSRKCQQLTRILPIRAFIGEVSSLHRYTKIGCLDFGTKCIGVAMSDETKQYSFPVGAIFVKQPPQAIESITDLHRQLQLFSRKENISYFVVGFPMLPGALRKISPLGKHIVSSIQAMPQDGAGLTFCMWDEEYSTSDARLAIKAVSGKKSTVIKHKDAVAASVILKDFLRAYRILNRATNPGNEIE